MEFLIPQAWDQIISWENYPVTKLQLQQTPMAYTTLFIIELSDSVLGKDRL